MSLLLRTIVVTLICCLTFSGWAMAQEDAKEEPAQQPAAEEPAAEEPAAEEPDPYAVPDGTPAELIDYVQGLLRQPPPNPAAREKAIAAILEAADKILAGEPDESQAGLAISVKMRFIESIEKLQAFAEELRKSDRPKLARQADGAILNRQLRGALGASEEDIRKLVGQVKEYLGAGPLQPSDVNLAMTVGQLAERSDNTELAVETYTSLAELLKQSDNESIAKLAESMEGVVRRLMLIGNPMKLEGTLLGGEAIDWAAYRGKVVLVDFWATWCGPCVREVPHMKETYQQYHERGFEIVGISLDNDREQLEKFIEEKEVPWKIIFNEEGANTTADYYGVRAIPTMILVAADGNVVSTKARGPKLSEELEKLLGPPEEKEEEAEEKEEETDAKE